MRVINGLNESQLQVLVADYISIRYPDVQFRSDYGAGVRLTAAQAAIQRKQNGGRRGWPDMFIAEPRVIEDVQYAGLFLELKRSGTHLVKVRKPDEWYNDHIAEQAEVLRKLNEKGYMADFAVGFDAAKKIIDFYLGDEE